MVVMPVRNGSGSRDANEGEDAPSLPIESVYLPRLCLAFSLSSARRSGSFSSSMMARDRSLTEPSPHHHEQKNTHAWPTMQRRGAGTALAHVVVTSVDVLVGGQGLNVGQVLAGVDDDLLRPVLDQVVQHQQGLQNNNRRTSARGGRPPSQCQFLIATVTAAAAAATARRAHAPCRCAASSCRDR